MKNSPKRAQSLLILLCWFAYAASYVGRLSYNANISQIEEALGVGHAQSGAVTTCFFVAYGCGQLVNAFFCRKYPHRSVLGGALLLSAGVNAALFCGVPFSAYAALWFVNGLALSTLYSSMMVLFGAYLDRERLGKAVLLMSLSANAGIFAAYGMSALFALDRLYRYVFLVAALVSFAAGAVWLIFFGKLRGALVSAEPQEREENREKGRVGISLYLYIGLFAVFAVIDNLVRDGLTVWMPSMLIEQFGLGGSVSIVMTLALPALAFFGTALAMWLDRIFRDRFLRTTAVLFGGALACTAGVYALLGTSAWLAVVLLFGIIACFMGGFNNLITSAMPLYFRDRLSPGFVSGFLDAFCYVGSAIGSFGLGSMADGFGWESVFLVFLFTMTVPVLCGIVSLPFRRGGRLRQREKEVHHADIL